jgi:hypothetical protein
MPPIALPSVLHQVTETVRNILQFIMNHPAHRLIAQFQCGPFAITK